MSELDLYDSAVIAASPDRVWEALRAEFLGARQWWVPWNTFEPLDVSPETVGGGHVVTVHPKGVGGGGPTLPFTARTRAVVPGRRWDMDYVDGVFRGSCSYQLTALDDGTTELAMTFRAQPRDLAGILSHVVDLGHEHSKGFQGAMVNLNRFLTGGDSGSGHAGLAVVPAPVLDVVDVGGRWVERSRQVVPTDDDAALSVTSWSPTEITGPVTVVLLHGWGGGQVVWDQVRDQLLAQGRRVVTTDLRGHGASTMGAEGFTVDRLGRDLLAVLAAVPVQDSVLVGHSGGGFAVLSLAASEPERFAKHVQSVLFVSSTAHQDGAPDSEVAMMGHPVFAAALRLPGLGRRLLAQMTGPRASATVRETNRQLFAGLAPDVRAAAFRSSQKLDLDAGAVPVPALVLVGEQDRIIDPAANQTLADALPLGRLRTVPGAGHQLPLEAPAEIASAVEDLVAAAI